jgi:GntR family transcriptional regulator / MocR family aminotransferase
VTISAKGARSGPAMSTLPFSGAASATCARIAATSSAAIGWKNPSPMRTVPSAVLKSAIPPMNSMNWVARTIVYGTPAGLRLAYVVVPERAVERVGRVARSMNAGSPTLLQSAVTDFIGQGHFARHLKRMRALYAERRVLIVRALEPAFGERLIVDLPPGGIQFAVQFTEGPDGPVDDVAVAARAREAGLAVTPLSIWYTSGGAARALRGLVMGFANIADANEAGRLARTLCACLDG